MSTEAVLSSRVRRIEACDLGQGKMIVLMTHFEHVINNLTDRKSVV